MANKQPLVRLKCQFHDIMIIAFYVVITGEHVSYPTTRLNEKGSLPPGDGDAHAHHKASS
jgi:hypothetical protein